MEKDTFLATPLLEEVRLSHNPGLYWIHPEVMHSTVLYCTVLYCTQAWPLDTEDTDVPWRVRRLDLSWCGLTRLPSMLPTSYSDWATLTRYCTVLFCTVLYCTVLHYTPSPASTCDTTPGGATVTPSGWWPASCPPCTTTPRTCCTVTSSTSSVVTPGYLHSPYRRGVCRPR